MKLNAWGLDTLTVEDNWKASAACRGWDPELWSLPAGRRGATYKLAHRICHGCPVKRECFDYGVQSGSWGVILGGRDFDEPGRWG